MTSPHQVPATKLSTISCQQGFTLLEVMVALAILAVVAVSASQASRSYTQSVGNMQTRSNAYFIAQNTLADLRIQHTWPISSDVKQLTVNGQQWQVTVTPQDTTIDTLKKLDIAVAPINNGNVAKQVVSIEALLGKPAPSTGQSDAVRP